MATYYEVISIREYADKNTGEAKKQSTRVGVAFPFREKEGFSIQLDAIPAPQEGAYRLLVVPPRPKDDNKPSQSGIDAYRNKQADPTPYGGEIDDEIPF